MKLLAQLRGTLLHIRNGRVVLRRDQRLARRSGVAYRAQLPLGRRQLALGFIEAGGEAFGRGQQLVFVPLRGNDIVARPECLYLLPFRRYLLLQRLNRIAQLVGAGPCRFLVSSRQMLLVDARQCIHQLRQKLPLRTLGAQQHHLSALDGFSAEHLPHAVDRIVADLWRQVPGFRQTIDDLFEQRATGEDLNFGQKGAGTVRRPSPGLGAGFGTRGIVGGRRRRRRSRGDLQPRGRLVLRRPHDRVGQAEEQHREEKTQKRNEPTAPRLARRQFLRIRRKYPERKLSIVP